MICNKHGKFTARSCLAAVLAKLPAMFTCVLLVQYADRLAIGLESIIRNVPASTVKGFYDKWYSPENMAVVIVGDFQECQPIVDLIREKLEPCQAHNQREKAEIPRSAALKWLHLLL